MKSMKTKLPLITFALLALFLLLLASRSYGDTTMMLVAGSLAMFACCWASAAHLLGGRAALRFVVIGVAVGWFAEQMGASRGWFFGSYTYTEVLGPRLGEVPVIIPLMWFALCYIAYVIANLIVWQVPSDGDAPPAQMVTQSLLAAMIVTAYDLGADPYMVFKLKAWIMTKTDGWWFGETLEGFFGWALVSFVIIMLFRLSTRKLAQEAVTAAAAPVARKHLLVPLVIYGGNMVFQMALGTPVETRTIALFAMGIPLLAAACGFSRWQAQAAQPEVASQRVAA
jgi:putative membrane protein